MIEEPEQEEQQQDGSHHGSEHPVELGDAALILAGTGLKFTILARVGHQVDIGIAVLIAAGLVVDGGVCHTELLAYARHKVGCLIDGGIGEGLLEIVEG